MTWSRHQARPDELHLDVSGCITENTIYGYWEIWIWRKGYYMSQVAWLPIMPVFSSYAKAAQYFETAGLLFVP